MARVVTYECDECGCEIVVTETPESRLTPIYCCDMEVSRVSSTGKTAPAKAAKKTVKKVSKKKVAAKKVSGKKAVPRKQTVKKSR